MRWISRILLVACTIGGGVLGAWIFREQIDPVPPAIETITEALPSKTLEQAVEAIQEKLVQTQPPAKVESYEWFLGFMTGKKVTWNADLPQLYRLVQGECLVGFDGKSTLHDFRGQTKKVVGAFQCKLAKLGEGVKGSVIIDASSLDTQDPARDKEMHENYLHTKKFPQIVLQLQACQDPTWDASFESGRAQLHGELEIHGIKKQVLVPIELQRRGPLLSVKGKIPLKMSSFSITPPSKFFVIRVEDEVLVWFDLQAKLSEELH